MIVGRGAGNTWVPNPEPDRLAWDPTNMVRRDVTTKSMKEDPGAFGNDFVQGNVGKDDVYDFLGNDWLERNDGEDAIVGDMGKIVNNNLGTDDAYEILTRCSTGLSRRTSRSSARRSTAPARSSAKSRSTRSTSR